MTSDNAAVDRFEGGDFFPERKPADYPSFHNYRRDREAARLSAQGYGLLDICEQLDLRDTVTGEFDTRKAVAAVKRGLSMVHQFSVDEKRTEQLHSLEMIKKHLWESLDREHVMVQQGKVIMIEGIPVEDRRFVLETFDRILKAEDQQAKLLGTNATTRVSIEADQIGGEIAQLIAMIHQAPTTVVVQQPALEAGDGDA